MSAVVIDTNVLVMANSPVGATVHCATACSDALRNARNGVIVLDDKFRILKEYKKNVSETGQPGAGDQFLLWLLRNRTNDQVECVPLTERGVNDYEEFPTDPDLEKFDPSDRKFVAVALGSRNNPEILYATDRGWRRFHEPLKRSGVRVKCLCPELTNTQITDN